MKGILESVTGFFQIIIALAVIVILFLMIFRFSNVFKQSDEITMKGSEITIAKDIAKYVQDCWSKHRSGLDPDSAICKTLHVNISETITEYDVTQFLNCDVIPNNDCSPFDCSLCASSKYPDQDKLKMENIKGDITVKISYSGARRIVEVKKI